MAEEEKKQLDLSVAVGAPTNRPDDGDIFVDDINKALSGVKGLKQFEQMETDDKISGFLRLVFMVLLKPKWTSKPSDPNSQKAKDNAEFLTECKKDLQHGFANFLEESFTLLIYGFSFFEVVYKIRGGSQNPDIKKRSKYADGKIGWRDFGVRNQITLLSGGWLFNEFGEVIGVIQELDDRTVTLTMDRCFGIKLGGRFRNPQGRSVLYGAYENWKKKKQIGVLESIGIERDLAGLPVMYCDVQYFGKDEKSKQKLAEMQNCVSNIRRNEVEGVVLPSNRDEQGHLKNELTLLNSGGARQFNINETINRLDLGILTSLLADFMAVGHGDSGSFSLHSDKTEMFLLSLEAVLNKVRDTLNEIEIPRLFAYNGIFEELPSFEYEPIKKEDVTQLIDNIVKLAGIGMEAFPDGDFDRFIREKLDLPVSTEK